MNRRFQKMLGASFSKSSTMLAMGISDVAAAARMEPVLVPAIRSKQCLIFAPRDCSILARSRAE